MQNLRIGNSIGGFQIRNDIGSNTPLIIRKNYIAWANYVSETPTEIDLCVRKRSHTGRLLGSAPEVNRLVLRLGKAPKNESVLHFSFTLQGSEEGLIIIQTVLRTRESWQDPQTNCETLSIYDINRKELKVMSESTSNPAATINYGSWATFQPAESEPRRGITCVCKPKSGTFEVFRFDCNHIQQIHISSPSWLHKKLAYLRDTVQINGHTNIQVDRSGRWAVLVWDFISDIQTQFPFQEIAVVELATGKLIASLPFEFKQKFTHCERGYTPRVEFLEDGLVDLDDSGRGKRRVVFYRASAESSHCDHVWEPLRSGGSTYHRNYAMTFEIETDGSWANPFTASAMPTVSTQPEIDEVHSSLSKSTAVQGDESRYGDPSAKIRIIYRDSFVLDCVGNCRERVQINAKLCIGVHIIMLRRPRKGKSSPIINARFEREACMVTFVKSPVEKKREDGSIDREWKVGERAMIKLPKNKRRWKMNWGGDARGLLEIKDGMVRIGTTILAF